MLHVKRTGIGIIGITALVLILPVVFFALNQKQDIREHAASGTINNLLQQHFFGGFTINTTDKVADAASDGLQIALYYGGPAHTGSQLEQALQKLNMTEIDGYVTSVLFDYECHKSKVFPDPSDPKKAYWKHTYCKTDNYPFFTDDNAVIASVSAHLHSVATNSLIVGYWVLDDQALWDTPGYAINILNQTHTLIQQITPGKAAICGYGGFLGVNKTYSWYRPLALNFTSLGCDMVGWYVYSTQQQNSNPPVDTNTFDWTMSGLLASMSADLQTQGWNMQKTPLIGIPQGWAGTYSATSYEATPSAQNMQTQAESFCKYGAQGVIWYAWGNSPPINQFPWNNTTLKQGVQQGVRTCQNYWNTISITPSPNAVTFSLTVCPHGLGNCGDNANPTSQENTHPFHTQRAITLSVYDTNNHLVATKQGNVIYTRALGNFQGVIDVTNLPSGQYSVKIHMDGFLSKLIPGIVTITHEQQITLPPTSLVTGDINNDNRLDILDYNLLISCFGSKQNSSSCPNAQAADLNDDRVVDGADYNLFLKELSVQHGG